jgi:hypothetical protein
MACKILLYSTTLWPSAARYAGGFVTAGCEAFALAPKTAPVMTSRYVTKLFRYNPLAPLKSLRGAIAGATPDLIIACDDRAVATLLRLYHSEQPGSEIARLLARSMGTPQNYARVLSRSGALNELHAVGVRVPTILPVRSEAELNSSLSTIGLPAVLKSDGSWGGEGVIIVQTIAEAVAAWRKLSRPVSRLRSAVRTVRRRDAHFLAEALRPSRHAVSIQRFVPGTPAASAFAAFEGKVVGAIYYDVLDAQGGLGPPNVIRRVDSVEMETATKVVAQRFGLSGLHGLDFIRDASGGLQLIEINARATQGGTLPFGAGHDLPSALISAFSNRPVRTRRAIEEDVVVFFPREWQRDPESTYLKMGHHDVPWDDPAILMSALTANPRWVRRAA